MSKIFSSMFYTLTANNYPDLIYSYIIHIANYPTHVTLKFIQKDDKISLSFWPHPERLTNLWRIHEKLLANCALAKSLFEFLMNFHIRFFRWITRHYILRFSEYLWIAGVYVSLAKRIRIVSWSCVTIRLG